MKKAFLLSAVDGIVSGIKIRYKHSSELFQKLLNDLPFTAFGENIDDIREAGQHPNICYLPLNVGAGLIGMNQVTRDNPIKDRCFGIGIEFGRPDLKFVQRASNHAAPKQSIDAVLQGKLRDTQTDGVIDKIGYDVPTPIPTVQVQIAQPIFTFTTPTMVC